jgi:DNA ligase (NAD+)
MIIPQIAENKTKSGNLEIPSVCPVCGGVTEIRNTAGAKSLFCTNPKCMAKKLKSLAHFVSRDAMNIDGLSEATMEKLVSKGFIHEYADLFRISEHRDEIIDMDGFGIKSYENLINSCNKARNPGMANFIYALGISNVGLSNAKLICRYFENDWKKITHASGEQLLEIEGVGQIIADSFVKFFTDEDNCHIVEDCLQFIEFTPEDVQGAKLNGMVFVITGSLNHYTNRSELKNFIEANGGKVASAVSGNTNYLINNDVASNSSKNKKAKELGIEIISEETFVERFAQKI